MNKPKICIIAAIGENHQLGKNNKLLWHIPEDLKRFNKLTVGHVVIMGRKTFESIIENLGRPLPQRTNIVVTRNVQSFNRLYKKRVYFVDSLVKAIEKAKERETKEIFVIGGGQIYKQAIKYTNKLYLTIVERNYAADTFFPDYSKFKRKIFEKKEESGNYKYRFVELEK
jgi:dihydrofolate reductase